MVPPFAIPTLPSIGDYCLVSPVRLTSNFNSVGGSSNFDIYWSNVSLMMGFDNTTGPTSATFIDESIYNNSPITAAGSGVNWINDPIDPVFIGTGSGRFVADGGRPAITSVLPVQLQLGLSDFTVEMFAYTEQTPAFMNPVGNIYTDPGSWAFSYASGRWCFFVQNLMNLSSNSTTPLSTWTHIAVSRNGDTGRLFINGNMVHKTTGWASLSVMGANPILVGAGGYYGNGQWFKGKIDELRITKGVGRYNTDSSFPVISAKYPRTGS